MDSRGFSPGPFARNGKQAVFRSLFTHANKNACSVIGFCFERKLRAARRIVSGLAIGLARVANNLPKLRTD
jgi:hypothetical protein